MDTVDEKARHYDAGGIETIDVIKAKLNREQYIGYLLGNIIKYSHRFNFKGNAARDAEKLRFYVKWLEDVVKDEPSLHKEPEAPDNWWDADTDAVQPTLSPTPYRAKKRGYAPIGLQQP